MNNQINKVNCNQKLSCVLSKICGLKSYNFKLGYGTFLTIDFGNPIEICIKTKKGEERFVRGEWHFWLYMCAWRWDKNNRILIGSGDSRKKIEKFLKKMEGQELVSYKLNDSFDVTLAFSNSCELKIFTIHTEDQDQWMIYTPDKHVLTIGASNKCFYESSS